jgi:phage terminase large subunit-like protein
VRPTAGVDDRAVIKSRESEASGTQLIQELISEGCYGVTSYQPTCDKIMRLHAQTAIIENGFVRIPETYPPRWRVSRARSGWW